MRRSKKSVAIVLVVCFLFCSFQIGGKAETVEAAVVSPIIVNPSLPPQLAFLAVAGELVLFCGEKIVQSFSGNKESGGNGSSNNNGNDEDKYKDAIPLSIKLVGGQTALIEAAKNIKPLQGYTDVIIHGAPEFFGVLRNGEWIIINHRSLATFMRQSGYTGGPVRLISCNSGRFTYGVAQDLANKLGSKVIAPTNTIWIFKNGTLVIGDTPIMPKGHWQMFLPGR